VVAPLHAERTVARIEADGRSTRRAEAVQRLKSGVLLIPTKHLLFQFGFHFGPLLCRQIVVVQIRQHLRLKGFRREDFRGLLRATSAVLDLFFPICGADLGYSVASVNGHIWAACKTDGCVRFMQ